MSKILGLLTFLVLTTGLVSAQEDIFKPANPITMGRGGAFTADGEGYNAFFYNPAGFNRKSEFSFSVNGYGIIDNKIIKIIFSTIGGANPLAGGDSGNPADALAGLGITIDETQITELETFVTDVNTNAPNAFGDALVSLGASNPELQALLPSDPSTLSNEQAIALLIQTTSDPQELGTLIDSYIAAVAAASGETPGASLANIGTDLVASLENAFPSGNINGGVSLGLGYVGNGFGIGLFANAEVGVYTPEGKSILSAQGIITNTITLAGGAAFELAKGLDIGFLIRPTILGYTSIDPLDILLPLLQGGEVSADLNSLLNGGVYQGFYLGLDVGVLWDVIDGVTLGATLKDIIPYQVSYTKFDTIDEYLANFGNVGSGLAAGIDLASLYQVPPLKLNVGIMWAPQMGDINKIISPKFNLDLLDLFGFIRYLDETGTPPLALVGKDYDFLNFVNLGAEIKFFEILSARAGYYSKSLTLGIGAHLLFLDINAAFAFKNPKEVNGEFQFTDVGGSLEVAIRF